MGILDIIGSYEYQNKKYIVANLDNSMKILNYQIDMINSNQGNGFLAIEKKQFNSDIQLQYYIGNNITLEDFIYNKSNSCRDLAGILKNIISIIKISPEYLLNENNLIMNTTYIFVDEVKRAVELIYLPIDTDVKINIEAEFKNMIKNFSIEYINKVNKEKKDFIESILSITESEEYTIDKVEAELERIIEKPLEIINSKLNEVEIIPQIIQESEKKKGFLSKLFKGTDNESKRLNTEEFMKNVDLSRREILTTHMYETDIINDTQTHLVFNKNGSIDKVNINKNEFIIGRMKGQVDYVLDNPAVGKMHAKILKNKSNYFLVDLQSKNHTFINGEKIKPNKMYQLNNDDEITFANVKAKYKQA